MRITECGIKKKIFLTPMGWIGAAATDKGIIRIVLPKKNKKAVEQELTSSGCGGRSAEKKAGYSAGAAEQLLNKTVILLTRYFSGKTVLFDLPLDIRYYTSFQQAVWRAAMQIPDGETRSYGWIARRIKNPQAARAVGQAMGANPIPVIIP